MLNNHYSIKNDLVNACSKKQTRIFTRIFVSLMLFLLLITSLPSQALAAGDSTEIGTLSLYPAFENMGVISSFSSDDNDNNQTTLEYRLTGSGSWNQGIPMTADRRDNITYYPGSQNPDRTVANPWVDQWRAVIFALEPDTGYEVRVTYTDPDGVSGGTYVSSTEAYATTTTITRSYNPPSSGTTYYVSTTGNNGNNGLSSGAAFRTIQHAADIVVAGDRVLVASGTYNEQVTLSGTSGQGDNYITFESISEHGAIIDAGGTIEFNFRLQDSDYIRIKDFYMKDAAQNPVRAGNSNYLIIENNIVENGYHSGDKWARGGIWLRDGSHHGAILGNEIYRSGTEYETMGIFISSTRTSWQGQGGHVIKGNEIYGAYRDGIGMSGATQYLWSGLVANSFVYDNYVHDIPDDDGLEIEGANVNVAVFDNIVDSVHHMALGVAPIAVGPMYIVRNLFVDCEDAVVKAGSTSSGYAYFYHNTMYGNYNGPSQFGSNSRTWNQTWRNNIVVAPSNGLYWRDGAGNPTNSFDYNIWQSGSSTQKFRWGDSESPSGDGKFSNFGDFQSWTGQEEHGIYADPMVANPGSSDYSLQAGSPAIDNGVILPGFNDANSPWPYSGSAPDMGAFEYNSGPIVDNTPPYTSRHNPAKGASGVARITDITVHVRDSGVGVNQSSIVMTVEGAAVTPTITGSPADYTLTYNPPSDFAYGQVVNVTVDAQDLDSPPNVMAQDAYSFTIAGADSTAPYISGHNPAKNATGVARNTNIVVHVRDNGDGVNQSSIVMTVEGATVTPTITGTASDYTLTYNPPVGFAYEQVVNVTVDARDLAPTPNVMTQDAYAFTITAEGGQWPALPFRVNCAGADYTDGSSNLWNADRAYTSGSWGFSGTNNTVDRGTGLAISGTTDDRIYQTERYRLDFYRFGLGNGTYSVELHLAETFYSAAGQRVMDISAEGQLVLDNLDVFAEAGSNAALIKTINNISVTDGQLTISFTPVAGQTEINGIVVMGSSANQPPVAVNNSYSMAVDATLNVPAPGILSNDSDPNSDPLTAVLVGDVSNGNLTLNANGSFTYTPDTGYTGSDSFAYQANDGQANSNTATVSLAVNGATPPGGGGGGGGGGGANGFTNVSQSVISSGRFLEDITAKSVDGKVELFIPENTIGLNQNGFALTSISLKERKPPPPPPPYAKIMGLAYEVGPSGATFNPPVNLTFQYEGTKVPQGVAEKNLVIAMYDWHTQQWQGLECAVDTANDSVTARVSHFSTYATLAYYRPASFEVTDFTVTPGEVELGDAININILVTNTGDLTDSYEVSLKLDDAVVATMEVALDGGDSQPVTFSIIPDTAGEHKASIQGLQAVFTVKELKAPAAFDVSALTITPAEVNIGDGLIVYVLVSNTGEATGSYTVSLELDNVTRQTREVTLNGGDNVLVDFNITTGIVGEHKVNINGLVGIFEVMAPVPVDEIGISRLTVTPIYDTEGKLVSASIDYQVNEAEELSPEAELILKVFLDGDLLEELPLLSISQMQPGLNTGSLEYIPAVGWSTGTYVFQAELHEDGGLVHSTQQERFTLIPPSITEVVSWGSLGIIIGATLFVGIIAVAIVLYRRRDTLRGYFN